MDHSNQISLPDSKTLNSVRNETAVNAPYTTNNATPNGLVKVNLVTGTIIRVNTNVPIINKNPKKILFVRNLLTN